jgi:hypothetical protein
MPGHEEIAERSVGRRGTIANVLAYARLVLSAPPGSRAAACLEAMEAFCRAWAGVYDAVFYCYDQFA